MRTQQMNLFLVVLGSLLFAGSNIVSAKLSPSQPFATQVGNQTIQQTYYYFTQKLDHFNPSCTTEWQQRITVYNTPFNPTNGTVFIFIGGEGPEGGMTNGTGFVVQLANQFSGMIISVEHRFYGSSQPFGQDANSYSTANLAYLTVDQSLADLAYFIQSIKADNFLGVSETNPFITIGGSYPGAMSAWFRYKFPHLTAGSLASSAVVNAILDFQQYDYQIYTSTLKSGEWCPNRIQNFNNIIEETILAGGQGAADLRTLFSAEILTDDEFLQYFGDFWAGMVQYGKRTKLCEMFNTESYQIQLNNVLAYAKVNQTTEGYDTKSLQNTTYDYNSSGRQWTWQVCTYFGWLQTANSVQPMRSSRINLDFYSQQCQTAFGDAYTLPDVSATNANLGGKYIDTTNIIFTNGVEDEWQWASIRQSKDEMVAIISDCPDCGHCVELRLPSVNDSPQLQATRKTVTEYFALWIVEHYADQSNKLNAEKSQQEKSAQEQSFVQDMLSFIHNQ